MWVWMLGVVGLIVGGWICLVSFWIIYFVRFGRRMEAAGHGYTANLTNYNLEPWLDITSDRKDREVKLTLVPEMLGFGRCFWSIATRPLKIPPGSLRLLEIARASRSYDHGERQPITFDDQGLDERFQVRRHPDDAVLTVRTVLDDPGFRDVIWSIPMDRSMRLRTWTEDVQLKITGGFMPPDVDTVRSWFDLLHRLADAIEASLDIDQPYR